MRTLSISGQGRPSSAALVLAATLAAAPAAHAHLGGRVGDLPQSYHELAATWGRDLGILIPLALALLLYLRGTVRLWRVSRPGRGIRWAEFWCFICGWLALFVALVSPLHPWGNVLFAAHMTQHEILMLVAAPFLVLGRPLIAFLWALPSGWAPQLARAAHTGPWQLLNRFFTNAFIAWVLHAIVLWTWHLPSLFQATLSSDLMHAAQHASFLASALLFWWAVIHGHGRALGYGAAVLYLFTTALHTSLLGALLTFANSVWYPAYSQTTQAWGLTPLEDQQLGGLIMWIPASLVYIIAGLALFAAWLRESELRARRRESSPEPAPQDEPLRTSPLKSSVTLLIGLSAALSFSACDKTPKSSLVTASGGDPDRGKASIEHYGCAGCHTIPGIRRAVALVGPRLDHLADRNYVGGVADNSPANLIQWIQDPQSINPKTGMPNLHVSEPDARDIATYLYTLR